MSPHRQLVEAFVARNLTTRVTVQESSGLPAYLTYDAVPRPWLDIGGGKRQCRGANVTLDLEFNRDTRKVAKAQPCEMVEVDDPRSVALRPIQGTVERLPFRDTTFGLCTAVEMLYLVPDLERALAEIHRVLQPGGRLVLTCPFSRPSNEPGDWRRPTEHAWRWMLEHAGFHVERVEPLGGPWSVIWQASHVATAGTRSGSLLGRLAARTAPLARRLDGHCRAAWPLGYGVVATAPPV